MTDPNVIAARLREAHDRCATLEGIDNDDLVVMLDAAETLAPRTPSDDLPSEAEVFRTMQSLLEGIAQIAENHGFERGDDLQVWLAKNLSRRSLAALSGPTGWLNISTAPEGLSDLVKRLQATAAQLRKMAEQASFGGEETGVRVKDPALLLADLDEAAAALVTAHG